MGSNSFKQVDLSYLAFLTGSKIQRNFKDVSDQSR